MPDGLTDPACHEPDVPRTDSVIRLREQFTIFYGSCQRILSNLYKSMNYFGVLNIFMFISRVNSRKTGMHEAQKAIVTQMLSPYNADKEPIRPNIPCLTVE